jgi:hypothetical protein
MQQKNNKTLIISVIGIIILFVVILPYIDCMKENMTEITKSQDVSETKQLKVSDKVCSVSCCNYTQWTPLNPELKMYAHNPNSPYVPSNYTCWKWMSLFN